jgi:hypothetical protein
MTTLAYTLSDSRVMLRRNLKHQLRYPSLTVCSSAYPSCSCYCSSTSSADNSALASAPTRGRSAYGRMLTDGARAPVGPPAGRHAPAYGAGRRQDG